jgi:hypothetical protein
MKKWMHYDERDRPFLRFSSAEPSLIYFLFPGSFFWVYFAIRGLHNPIQYSVAALFS